MSNYRDIKCKLDKSFSSDSQLLRKLLTIGDGGKFPNLEEQLDSYETSFDRLKAKEEGVIIPRHGMNKDYDSSSGEVTSLTNQLEQYLKEQRGKLGCQVSGSLLVDVK